MKVFARKTHAGALYPDGDDAMQLFCKLKIGQVVSVEIKRTRNYQFHKKMFALFGLAFDVWEPEAMEYKGVVVEKDFDRFRKDMIILAGFYKAVYNARGEVRLEAESLSFSSMNADRFELVFKSVLSVVWKHVLRNKGYQSEADVELVVSDLMRFE